MASRMKPWWVQSGCNVAQWLPLTSRVIYGVLWRGTIMTPHILPYTILCIDSMTCVINRCRLFHSSIEGDSRRSPRGSPSPSILQGCWRKFEEDALRWVSSASFSCTSTWNLLHKDELQSGIGEPHSRQIFVIVHPSKKCNKVNKYRVSSMIFVCVTLCFNLIRVSFPAESIILHFLSTTT